MFFGKTEIDTSSTLIPCQTGSAHVTPSLFAAGLEKLGSAKPCLISEKDFFSSPHAAPTCHRNCGYLHVSEDTINLTVELQGATYYWLKTMIKTYLAMCSIAVASDQLYSVKEIATLIF